jgi:hypothetical protein
MRRVGVGLALAVGLAATFVAVASAAHRSAGKSSALTALPSPTAPFQRASADGVTVLAGANGVVEFRNTGVSKSLAELFRGSVTYGCFLGSGSGGYKSTFANTRFFQFAHQLDRCEIEASYGRLWPDRFHSHAAVEIAFTAAGRAYFADRAAARDLALFIRTGLTQTIRKQSGTAFRTAITARYGRSVVHLASPMAPIVANRIGYTPTTDGVTLVEESSTGKRFSVHLAHGFITRQDLRPYTLLVLFQKRR